MVRRRACAVSNHEGRMHASSFETRRRRRSLGIRKRAVIPHGKEALAPSPAMRPECTSHPSRRGEDAAPQDEEKRSKIQGLKF